MLTCWGSTLAQTWPKRESLWQSFCTTPKLNTNFWYVELCMRSISKVSVVGSNEDLFKIPGIVTTTKQVQTPRSDKPIDSKCFLQWAQHGCTSFFVIQKLNRNAKSLHVLSNMPVGISFHSCVLSWGVKCCSRFRNGRGSVWQLR